MQRAVVAVVAGLIVSVALAGAALAGGFYPRPSPPPCAPPCPPPSPPPCTLITKMVPCMRTEIVAEVKPVTQCIPVKKIGFRPQKFMLQGTPVGQPCGLDPCTKCCPQPFCQVVEQQVPFEYYEKKTVQSYTISYKPVCRPVMLPQTYAVQAYPVCH